MKINWKFWKSPEQPAPAPVKPARNLALAAAVDKAGSEQKKSYRYEIKAPDLPKNVVPLGQKALVAMDNDPYSYAYEYARTSFAIEFTGFPGYPRLAMLATRAEYRAFAQAIATQLTREWIVLNSTDTVGDETRKKCTELSQAITDLGLRDTVRLAAEHESYYGRAQIFLDLDGHDREMPLIISDKTIKKDSKFRITTVEAMWTTPSAYNAIDPAAPDFYKPAKWFMMGKQVHSSRLMTIVTRPVPDLLKPAFNFGGISLSQLAEPYVDNWLRTRQSVSDLISNFSIVALQTSMEQVLQGTDPSSGDDLFRRAELFTSLRSNKGMMLLDKDREELVMLNVPLSGLAELQSQSQEQMCAVGHTPAVVLLGIAPTGFGNVAEGEIRTYYDWVAAMQEAYWRKPIETVVNILQLIKYGKIDPDIVVSFQPLYQMTPKELAEIRTADAATDGAYIDRGVLDLTEVREKLARNPESGYQGIDVTKVPEGEVGFDPLPQGEEDEDVP